MTNKNKNKIYGIIGTVVFHAIVLVLLFTLCFRTPLPLPGEAGVEVNLGMYAQGFGHESIQPEETEPIKETPKVEEQKVESNDVVEEDIVSEDDEVPAIEQPQEVVDEAVDEAEKQEETVEEKLEEIVPEEKPVVNQRAIFQAPKKDNSSSEGDDKGEGEKGKTNGLKDIERYEGNGGSGGGPAYDLGGRGAKSISSPSKNFSEEGKIVVEIKVNRDGRVVEAQIGRGTTIVDSSMHESALQAARNSIFNKDENAPEVQSGTITYTFIIRQ